jgi:hypothetical protein
MGSVLKSHLFRAMGQEKRVGVRLALSYIAEVVNHLTPSVRPSRLVFGLLCDQKTG